MAEPEVVQVADGTVTLVPLPELQKRQRSLGAAIGAARSQAAELGRQPETGFTQAGLLLLE